MSNKEKWQKVLDDVELILKRSVRDKWTRFEAKEIEKRGETEADFYQVWYKLCKLETMRKWVSVHGYLTNSQVRILKEYIGVRQWKEIKDSLR
jgi:hypothetical protein